MNDYDNDYEMERTECTTSKSNMITDNGAGEQQEQYFSISTHGSSHISAKLNEILNNDDA